jgi:hypothetical protein
VVLFFSNILTDQIFRAIPIKIMINPKKLYGESIICLTGIRKCNPMANTRNQLRNIGGIGGFFI